MSTQALEHYLKPLRPFLTTDGVTEICINQPGEVYIELHQQFTHHSVPELTLPFLENFSELVAEFNQQSISPEKPLLSGNLLNGERVQFVRQPACEKDTLVCSIRRPNRKELTLTDYVEQTDVVTQLSHMKRPASQNTTLLQLYQQHDHLRFIREAICQRKNILISGGTGTGKTTFLNACLKEIPLHERLITIEDTREVKIPHSNHVHLLAAKGQQGIAQIDMLDLFEACLRLRPDRIFLSELRGREAFPFLRAANSGHPGSLSTIHAESPKACFDQLIFMMQQAGTTSSDEQLMRYLKSIIHVIVQLKRSDDPNRFVDITDIYFNEAE